MSNAFDAIYDEEQSTSNFSSNIDSFKAETSKKAGELHRITYEEIFNITQSLEPVQAKFKTLDEPEKQEFKSKVSEISDKYAKKASEVSEDLVLSENEKKYEINSLMGDMVEELTEAATGVFSKNIIDDTAEAAQGTYSDLIENKKVPSISEETNQNIAGDISGPFSFKNIFTSDEILKE